MEKKERHNRAHVLVVPLPIQGHINPMLQFSMRLAFKGLTVTVLSATSEYSIQAQSSAVKIACISKRIDEGIDKHNLDTYFKHITAVLSQGIPEIITKQNSSGFPFKCLVYDSAIPWALDIAKQHGLAGASFFTQSCAVGAIYCHVLQGLVTLPIQGPNVSMPGLPPLEIQDIPSFTHNPEAYPSILDLVLKQFFNLSEVDWILFNTIEILEDEVVKWLSSEWPNKIKTIGPTIPSMFLDKRLKEDKDYGLHLFKPDNHGCMSWLDAKPVASVVYVSFGSLAELTQEQTEEIANGLKSSNQYFLWVVRTTEEKKLPTNFVKEVSEKGFIVTWCPQLKVLSHPAVGCFITHCGWNSTLEALSLGVPMVAVPQWTDQPTNAKFIVDVWKVGVRARVDEKEIVRSEEVDKCVREVMKGERMEEIRRNAATWKKLAVEAADEGGSSDKNIEQFAAMLVQE